MAEITARGLTKTFGSLIAVNGIDFQVEPGETYGLLGPNGAGKTTTMRMLAALAPLSGGSLTVAGLDVTRHSRAVRKLLGVVTQADGLDVNLSVRGNLEVFGELLGLTSTAARRRASEVLEFFDLTAKAAEDVDALSGGMKRRLAIARSLMGSPRVIVLDEPSTGLDPESRMRVWEELATLKRQGVTLILSTHYMDEAELLCDRIAIMSQGNILDEDRPAALIQRHGGGEALDVRPTGLPRGETRELLNSSGLPYREIGAVFRVPVSLTARELLSNQAGLTVTERTPNLEDVFLKVAGRGLNDQ